MKPFYSILPFLTVLFISCSSYQVYPMVSPGYSVHDSRFSETISNMSGLDVHDGNHFEIINRGDHTFHTLFKMIQSARKNINIEMYLVDDDEIGMKFAGLLAEKAKEGIRVNFIIDYIGGWRTGRKFSSMLKEAGVNLYYYNPLSLFRVFRVHNRTHKKIIVIDGNSGMIGGFGISDPWYNDGEDPDKIKDLQVKIKGPILNQIQTIFSENWKEVSGEILSGDEYYPELKKEGKTSGQMIHSIPVSGKGVMHQMFLFAMKSAQNYIYIENAYFVPDMYTLKTLKEAAKRGVDVRIVLPSPSKTDVPATAYAGRNYYEELIEAGVKIYEYEKQVLHSKFMIIDDRWVSLGSSNMDNRSFKKSQEANLNIMDTHFALMLKKIFMIDIADSNYMTRDVFNSRSFLSRINEIFVSLVESQL